MLLRGGFKVAKQRVLAEFERTYLADLVASYPSLAAMSRASGISTPQLRALLEKHGLWRRSDALTALRAGPR
jgi:hypothetical protein